MVSRIFLRLQIFVTPFLLYLFTGIFGPKKITICKFFPWSKMDPIISKNKMHSHALSDSLSPVKEWFLPRHLVVASTVTRSREDSSAIFFKKNAAIDVWDKVRIKKQKCFLLNIF